MPTNARAPMQPRFPKRPLLLSLPLVCGALLAIAAGPAGAQDYPAPSNIQSTLTSGFAHAQANLSWTQVKHRGFFAATGYLF